MFANSFSLLEKGGAHPASTPKKKNKKQPPQTQQKEVASKPESKQPEPVKANKPQEEEKKVAVIDPVTEQLVRLGYTAAEIEAARPKASNPKDIVSMIDSLAAIKVRSIRKCLAHFASVLCKGPASSPRTGKGG